MLKKIFIFAVIALILCTSVSCNNYKNEEQSVESLAVNSGIPFENVLDTAESVDSEESEKVAPTIKQAEVNIVALGDSIPRGYGLKNPSRDSFPSQVASHFSKIYSNVDLKNYAVDGMKSDELVELLQAGKAPAVKNADIIIICIGANNILQYSYDLLYRKDIDVEELFMSYGNFLMSDKSDMSAPKAIEKYIKDVCDYAASAEFTDKINGGVENLREDIPKIISYIRSVNKDAKIYFTTVYNPYKGMDFTLPYVDALFPLGSLSDKFVGLINDVITDSASSNGYKIVDVFNLFENDKGKNVNAQLDLSSLNLEYDPHPNLNGHTLIAQEFIKIITEDIT